MDGDCKCHSQGAVCHAPYCSFTTPTSSLPTAAAVKAMCPNETGNTSFTPSQFCVLFNATCTGANDLVPALATESTCETLYKAWTTTQQMCRSYHLCNATPSAANATTHCPHAQGYSNSTTLGGPCP